MPSLDNVKKDILIWDLSLLFLLSGIALYVLFALFLKWLLLIPLLLFFALSVFLHKFSTKHMVITKNCHLLQGLFFEQKYQRSKKNRQIKLLPHKQYDLFSFAKCFGFSCDLSKEEIRAMRLGTKECTKELQLSSFQKMLVLVFGQF